MCVVVAYRTMVITFFVSVDFRVLSHDDRVVIMKAAAGTVLRKDMSLNRRLYAWILGPDESPRAQLNYMLTHAHRPFVQAINSLFIESISRKQDGDELALYDGQRPYRILVSLMDKWEVGQPVLNTIFLDVVRCLKKESQLPEFNSEVNLFFLLLHFISFHSIPFHLMPLSFAWLDLTTLLMLPMFTDPFCPSSTGTPFSKHVVGFSGPLSGLVQAVCIDGYAVPGKRERC